MTAYQIVLTAHIAAGCVALLTFWSAAIARKGGGLHRRIGQAYLLAMCGVLLSACVTAAAAFSRGQTITGTFLAYLVVITGTACWTAWRAPRSKRDVGSFYHRGYAALAVANILAGLLVFGYGLQIGNVLLMGFCWIGILGGAGMLHRWRQRERPLNWWLREHFQAMLGNGVATHVAFLSIGVNRMAQAAGLSIPEFAPWFAPVAVALLAGIWLDRRYPAKWRHPQGKNEPRPAMPVAAG